MARRLAFTLAALLLIATSSTPSVALADSRSTFATLGHARLTIDSNLRAPSHLSAWAIDEYLARNTRLPPLGHALKRAETKYEVNALYLLAHAMHETGFGTSYISRRFHNLFGWNAADRDPTGLATRFRTYSASVDYVASQIAERYLTPGGQYYGGRPTLRGMRYYATDPLWGPSISNLANGMVLSTLSGRDLTFERPLVGDASTGQPVEVTITASAGDLPDGLRAAYRFVPVAVVEGGSPGGAVPPLDPVFRASEGTSHGNRLRISAEAPSRPGRYRLEVELRDSDGTRLTEYDVPEIPATGVRVYGSDAVSFELRQDPAGLAVVVTNEGRRVIPMMGAIPTGSAPPTDGSTAPAPPPTTLTAWLVGTDGTPSLFSTTPLDRDIAPGDTWTARIPAPDEASLPAVVLLRLDVGGEPGRLGGAPPGVFVVAAASVADPSRRLPPAPGGNSTARGPGAADPKATPDDPTIVLATAELTPADAVSRLLLNPDWLAPVATTKTSGGVSRPKASLAISVAPPTVRLSYIAVAQPKQPGGATIRISNSGDATLVGSASQSSGDLPADPASVPGGTAAGVATPSASPSADPAAVQTKEEPAPDPAADPSATGVGPAAVFGAGAGAVLLVTAVPAWGPATDPLVFTIPIGSIAPGTAVDTDVTLPPSAASQSTYLVLARVLPGNGAPPLPATMFWLRGAPPIVTPDASGAEASGAEAPDAQSVDDPAADAEASGAEASGADPTTVVAIPLGVARGTAEPPSPPSTSPASSASSAAGPTAGRTVSLAPALIAAAGRIAAAVPADGTAAIAARVAAPSHRDTALVSTRAAAAASHLDTALVHARGSGPVIAQESDPQAGLHEVTGDVMPANVSR